MTHEMSAISLDLLFGRDGAKDNFRELPPFEWSVCDPSESCQSNIPLKIVGAGHSPHNLEGIFDNCHRQMRAVVNKSSNIVLRHLRELLLKNVLEARENDETLPAPIIVDHAELDLA